MGEKLFFVTATKKYKIGLNITRNAQNQNKEMKKGLQNNFFFLLRDVKTNP